MIAVIPVAIVIFSVLAYKKWSPIILAPFMALLTCFVCRLPALDTMLNTYMPSVADFVSTNFFIFFLGALFGGVMEVTGAAQSICCLSVQINSWKICAAFDYDHYRNSGLWRCSWICSVFLRLPHCTSSL